MEKKTESLINSVGELDSYTQMNQTGTLSHTILKKKKKRTQNGFKT